MSGRTALKAKVICNHLAWFLSSLALCARYGEASRPEQIHIALGERVSQMTVMWSTWTHSNQSIVEYGTATEGMAFNATGNWQILFNRLSMQYIHTVKLDNLRPATKYWYRCGDGETWSTIYSFKTLQEGTEWSPRFIIYGDLGFRDGVSAKLLTKEAINETMDVILHNGDLAYDLHSDSGRVGDNFMKMIEPFAARVPYMVSVGNHEAFNWNYTNYKARFRMPGTPDNLWYSFKVGPVHFIIISTEVYFFLLYGGMEALHNHYTWMEDTLKEANKPKNREKWPWIITLGHRPMYCSNTALRYCRLETNPVRVGLLGNYGMEELFYKYGVDAAFWGHNHCYERLWPTVNGEVFNGSFKDPYRNPRAPVHITSGVAGNQEGTSSFRDFRQPWSAFGSTERGYTRMVPQNHTHLYLEQVSADRNGEIIDRVWIIKERHGSYLKLFPEDKKRLKARRRSRLLRLFNL